MAINSVDSSLVFGFGFLFIGYLEIRNAITMRKAKLLSFRAELAGHLYEQDLLVRKDDPFYWIISPLGSTPIKVTGTLKWEDDKSGPVSVDFKALAKSKNDPVELMHQVLKAKLDEKLDVVFMDPEEQEVLLTLIVANR